MSSPIPSQGEIAYHLNTVSAVVSCALKEDHMLHMLSPQKMPVRCSLRAKILPANNRSTHMLMCKLMGVAEKQSLYLCTAGELDGQLGGPEHMQWLGPLR